MTSGMGQVSSSDEQCFPLSNICSSLGTADNLTTNGPSNTVKFSLLFSVLYIINLHILWIPHIKVRNFSARILVLAIIILS